LVIVAILDDDFHLLAHDKSTLKNGYLWSSSHYLVTKG